MCRIKYAISRLSFVPQLVGNAGAKFLFCISNSFFIVDISDV
jgi:hypothetical protein